MASSLKPSEARLFADLRAPELAGEEARRGFEGGVARIAATGCARRVQLVREEGRDASS